MVAFHLLEGEFLLAMWADVVLPFPHGKFYVFGKGAEVKMTLVMSEDIGYDAEGLLNVAIAHETGDFFLYSSDVKSLLMESIVSQTKSIVYLAIFSGVSPASCICMSLFSAPDRLQFPSLTHVRTLTVFPCTARLSSSIPQGNLSPRSTPARSMS